MAKQLFEISNENLRASVSNYGARLVSLEVKTASGPWVSVCAGFSDLETYERPEVQYFGATVGRVAGRIAKGKFIIGDQELSLETNEGENHLHGGIEGAVHNKNWQVAEQSQDTVKFELVSPSGAGGFPGNVSLSAEYRLVGSKLIISLSGATDSATPLNLTNHAYWNLSGTDAPAAEHELQILSDQTIPLDKALLPTGQALSLTDTDLDFRVSRKVGTMEKLRTEPLPGYDHTYLLGRGQVLREAATLFHPGSGISMRVSTDAQALQFYSGNRNPTMQAGQGMKVREGNTVCLEAFGVNNPEIVGDFSSIVVTPDAPLKRVAIHEFAG